MPQKKKPRKKLPKRTLPLGRKAGLYLKPAGLKGRGVFCRQDIARGEILEITPALILNEKDTDQADKTVLMNYTFLIGNLSKTQRRRANLKSTGACSCVVMGLMSFCNHDEAPNAEIVWEEQAGSLYYFLRATRNIPKNAEICTVYGDHWFEDRKKEAAKGSRHR